MKIPQLLFYIKRSLNKNVVIYKYNKNENGQLDSKNPIEHYWILKEQKNKIAPLNLLERNLAYGFTITHQSSKSTRLNIKSIPYYPLKIVPFKNSYIAQIKLDGKWCHLVSVYVKLKQGFIKKVDWVDVNIKENETIQSRRLDLSKHT